MTFLLVLAAWAVLSVGTAALWSSMRIHQNGIITAGRAGAIALAGAALVAAGVSTLASAFGG